MTLRAATTRWIARARWLARPPIVLALFLPPLIAPSCFPDTAPNDVRTIEGFVQCLNNRASAATSPAPCSVCRATAR